MDLKRQSLYLAVSLRPGMMAKVNVLDSELDEFVAGSLLDAVAVEASVGGMLPASWLICMEGLADC